MPNKVSDHQFENRKKNHIPKFDAKRNKNRFLFYLFMFAGKRIYFSLKFETKNASRTAEEIESRKWNSNCVTELLVVTSVHLFIIRSTRENPASAVETTQKHNSLSQALNFMMVVYGYGSRNIISASRLFHLAFFHLLYFSLTLFFVYPETKITSEEQQKKLSHNNSEGSAKQCTSDKKNSCFFILSVAPFSTEYFYIEMSSIKSSSIGFWIAKSSIVLLNTSSLWMNEWMNGWRKRRKKTAHAIRMSHFISFLCYLCCWLGYSLATVLYFFILTFFSLSTDSIPFFCHAIINIFTEQTRSTERVWRNKRVEMVAFIHGNVFVVHRNR